MQQEELQVQLLKGIGTGARLALGAIDSEASLSIGAGSCRGIVSNIEPVGGTN